MATSYGISTLEQDGRITAYDEGATFSGPALYKIGPVKAYVITFFEGNDLKDDETRTIFAVDDERAEMFARNKFIPPFQLTEKITTWREVKDVE